MRSRKMSMHRGSGSLFRFPYYSSTPSFLTFVLHSNFFFFLKGGKRIIIWFGSWAELFAGSFSHTTKILQDVSHCHHLRMALRNPNDWILLVHAILISSGTCSNLASSNSRDWSQRCCPLSPNSPEVIPGKKGWHLRLSIRCVHSCNLIFKT